MKFSVRLVLATVGILLFSVLILVWTFRTALRRDLEANLAASLQREAELIQGALPDNPRGWDRIVGRLARDRGQRVTLVGTTGRPLADSRIPPGQLGTLEALAGREDVAAALAGTVGTTRTTDAGRVYLHVAVPGDPIVVVTTDLIGLEATAAEAQRSVLWAALLALVVGSVLALGVGRTVARPLGDLAGAARAIPAGQVPRFPRSGILEIDQLTQAIRDLGNQLADRGEAVRAGRDEASALVDAMVEGVLATDARGRITSANPAARRFLGFGPDDPLPDLPQLFRTRVARDVVDSTLRGDGVQDREVELGGRVLLTSSRPLASGGAVLVLHDLTALRRLEAVRKDFVANVSHELKTPITVIAGYADTLLQDETDPERRRFLEAVRAHAARMHQLVDDQLSLARIESGRWEPALEAVDLAGAARAAWSARTVQGTPTLRFEVRTGPGAETAAADPEAVQQILGNLFDNAIRHTPPDGTVAVHTRAEGGGVTLAVTDTGSGIPGEHLPRIFERYYRADPARSREAGGTGLGLAIVKHLTEAHGGQVRVESELGHGTTVSCWFPRPVT